MARDISARAERFWKQRLVAGWGARMVDQFGPHPPADWAELIDRTDDQRLEEALLALRRTTPTHPPTLGEFEAAIPPRGRVGEPTLPERLMAHAARLYGAGLCPHQRLASWTFFGDVGAGVVKGIAIPPCSQCGESEIRVRATEIGAPAA